ncbi:MAG: hypothetical protein Q8N43_03440, partial [Candidatus Azambacteria bacterium]|nr:hypothetical protein [Candidatus Azambacteria bacterium]
LSKVISGRMRGLSGSLLLPFKVKFILSQDVIGSGIAKYGSCGGVIGAGDGGNGAGSGVGLAGVGLVIEVCTSDEIFLGQGKFPRSVTTGA